MPLEGAIFVHGVGEQEKGYSALARETLGLPGQEVLWAPFADTLERDFLRRVERKGSRGNLTQKLVIGTLTDALAYQSNPGLRELIWDAMDRAFLRTRADRVQVFAHSLGGLIATDWLRSRNKVPCSRLHTFGCNVGLFNLGRRFDCPWQVENPGDWVNYVDEDDMLGYPLAADPGLSHVRDVKVSVGGWFTGWWGIAHTQYWSDRGFWKGPVKSRLAR